MYARFIFDWGRSGAVENKLEGATESRTETIYEGLYNSK